MHASEICCASPLCLRQGELFCQIGCDDADFQIELIDHTVRPVGRTFADETARDAVEPHVFVDTDSGSTVKEDRLQAIEPIGRAFWTLFYRLVIA